MNPPMSAMCSPIILADGTSQTPAYGLKVMNEKAQPPFINVRSDQLIVLRGAAMIDAVCTDAVLAYIIH